MDSTYTPPYPVVMEERSFISRVYGWMSFALVITAVVAMWVASTPSVTQFLFSNQFLFLGLIIGELILVGYLVLAIRRMSATTATVTFVFYAGLNGLVLSMIFVVYTSESLATTFFVTAGTFAVMSIYGYATKRDLTTIGNLALMGLIGVILATVVNLFWHNAILYWITTYIGILVFVGLIAYDTQKIKKIAAGRFSDSGEERKTAIIGALSLYLDFINLFLLLLRILGRRR